MSGTKSWSIGEVLTAADLNGNFTNLPYSVSAFTVTQNGVVAVNSSAVYAIAFPASRFSLAPICTFSTSSPVITPVLNAVTSGTVTVALCNNGNASSAATFNVYGNAIQMSSGTAAG